MVRAFGPDPELARPGVCALCGRQARGFGYVHRLRRDRHPCHRFCSRRCQELGSALAMGKDGMIDKTEMERRAIRDARRHLAEALNELGLMAPFHDRTAEEIDRLIEACIDGYQESMLRQAGTPFDDPLPF